MDEQTQARVLWQAAEQLKRTPEGTQALIGALRQAAVAFENNAHEYEQTGAYDPIEQLQLSRACTAEADRLAAGPAPSVMDEIPF